MRTLSRRSWVTVLVALAALAAASGGALWATNTWPISRSDGRPPTLARRAPTSRPPVSDPPPTCRSPLTPDLPLRLWIGGDSLAGSLGPALGTTAGNTGVVQGVFDSRVSSGLTTPGFFDWPKHATQEMARLDPEIVVFIIDTNDSEIVRTQTTTTNGVPDWKAKYGQLVAQMLDILGGPDAHRTLYWVGGPTIRDTTIDAGVRQLNDVARAVVQQHAHATYVDAYRIFGDSQGRFSFTLPDKTGKAVLVRSDDGVHFTPAGADLLGQAIFGSLDTQCHLLRQAAGSPKAVIETPGSTQVGPSTRTPTTTRPAPPPTPPPTPPPPPPTTTQPTLLPPVLPTSKT